VAATLRTQHSIVAASGNGKGVPPDKVPRNFTASAPGRGLERIGITFISRCSGILTVRLEHFRDLEGIDMDVEWMRLIIGLILYRPFFSRIEQHGLVNMVRIEGLAVNSRITGPVGYSPTKKNVLFRNVVQEWREFRKILLVGNEILGRVYRIALDFDGQKGDRLIRHN